MILLIAGVPGTGKTEIGNYLKEKYDFVHMDVEHILELPDYWKNIEKFIFEAKKNNTNLVITWGFMPGIDDNKILKLKTMEVKLIWFDGNRKAARKAFLKRGTVPESSLDIQMERIENSNIDDIFQPINFNTFKKDEDTFLDKDDIVKQLLKLAQSSTIKPQV